MVDGYRVPSWWMGIECHHGGWVSSAIMMDGYGVPSWWKREPLVLNPLSVIAVGGGLEATPIYMYGW